MVYVLVLGWLSFFIIQVAGGVLRTEKILTVTALVMIAGTILIGVSLADMALLALGLVLGLIIEVGLGLVARQQHWENASLYGVPYWLPLIWAYGFFTIGHVKTALDMWF